MDAVGEREDAGWVRERMKEGERKAKGEIRNSDNKRKSQDGWRGRESEAARNEEGEGGRESEDEGG